MGGAKLLDRMARRDLRPLDDGDGDDRVGERDPTVAETVAIAIVCCRMWIDKRSTK